MKILLNDWLTDKIIPPEHGVPQGHSLPPLLYVLCVDVPANLIRRSPEISGFMLPGAKGQQARVRLCADDTTCVIKDVRSLTKLFDCVNLCELGCKTDGLLGLTWVRQMKVHAVVFGTVSCEEEN